MKKILAVLLACSMLFAFAACGGNNEETTTTAAPETTTEAPAADETTAPAADETTAPAADETTAAGETTTEAAPAGEMTAADFAAFYNAETAKAAKGSYKYNRNCSYVNPIDVGNMTNALNKVIKMIDENSDIGTVVGGFLGIGTKKGSVYEQVLL